MRVASGGYLRANPDRWVDFMMRFELGLDVPDPKRASLSALTIAGSYIVCGLIPPLSYHLSGQYLHGSLGVDCRDLCGLVHLWICEKWVHG